MNKKLILILTGFGCAMLLAFAVLVGGVAYYINGQIESGRQLDAEYYTQLEETNAALTDAHVIAYTEIAAEHLGNRLKAAYPDHKVLLFCPTETAAGAADHGIDGKQRGAIQRGLAKTYGETTVTTLYVDIQFLTADDYAADYYKNYAYYFDYKVLPEAFTAAIAQADANTVCIWTLPLPMSFLAQPETLLPLAAVPVFTLFEVDTAGLQTHFLSGYIAAAIDFNDDDTFNYLDDVPADPDAAFSVRYDYIAAATIPALLQRDPTYFDPR